jgi:hypothetical protein
LSVPEMLMARSLKPSFEQLGYKGSLLRADFRIGESASVTLAGFAQEPIDARTACIAAVDASGNPREAAASLRVFGAPIVLVCHAGQLEFWKVTVDGPERVEEPIPPADVPGFFKRHKDDFSPDAVYRAKTWGRFDAARQLTFVDLGLMTAVESEIGEALGRLIERNVFALKSALRWTTPSDQQGEWLLKSVFWLVAAKILRDKDVPGFAALDLTDVTTVFAQLARHYGSDHPVPVSERRHKALQERASDIQRFATLAHVSTESLAYVYENTLISKETRQALGTHSTPAYLVDYVVGKLVNFIENIPAEHRNVFEPACGHAAFLVAAMRLLRELLPTEMTPAKRRRYLRTQLHGCDIDPFALEIARLSLTLADIPNPDGWDLQAMDLFAGNRLQDASRSATILLANPPFENFSGVERERYSKHELSLQHTNKAAELLARTLPHLPPGAAFGVVVPQGILHSKNATSLRRFLTSDCELTEICLFPDKVFNQSDVESAVLLGRRRSSVRAQSLTVSYRRVRERDMEEFRRSYSVSTKRKVNESHFQESSHWNLHIPDLEEVWLWCHEHLRLESIASIGQGLAFKGHGLPKNATTYQNHHFSGARRGFVHFGRDVQSHTLPEEYWLNLSPDVLLHKRTGVVTGVPQILLNYAPVSRGPWRLKPLIDRNGHAVTSRFLTVRPRSTDTALEFLWALCNSPFANAYAYTHSLKRDILAGTMRRMPIPAIRPEEIERVTDAALAYLRAVTPDGEALGAAPDPANLRRLLLQLDAEVLRLYALPPRLERQLLDLFAGWQRQGIPRNVTFDRYFPPDFEPCFPLHEYLSAEFQQSTAGKLRAAHRPIASQEWSAAMQQTLDGFQE